MTFEKMLSVILLVLEIILKYFELDEVASNRLHRGEADEPSRKWVIDLLPPAPVDDERRHLLPG